MSKKIIIFLSKLRFALNQPYLWCLKAVSVSSWLLDDSPGHFLEILSKLVSFVDLLDGLESFLLCLSRSHDQPV